MLLLEHEVGGDPMPAEGGYGVVLDGAGQPRCVIRSTEMRVVPFREVDAAFAHDEGEGDRTLQSCCNPGATTTGATLSGPAPGLGTPSPRTCRSCWSGSAWSGRRRHDPEPGHDA
jgi:hypothetical protein